MSEYEPLKGYEQLYKINKEGSIMNRHNKIRKIWINDGYYHIDLYENKKRYHYTLHRLLALQFIPNPHNFTCVDHINGIRNDNRLENLRWVSYTQNNNNMKSNSIHPHIYIKPNGTYQVQLYFNKKNNNIGCYKTLEAAMSERDCAIDFYGLPNYCYGLEPINNYV
jgi:hypothetical protein